MFLEFFLYSVPFSKKLKSTYKVFCVVQEYPKIAVFQKLNKFRKNSCVFQNKKFTKFVGVCFLSKIFVHMPFEPPLKVITSIKLGQNKCLNVINKKTKKKYQNLDRLEKTNISFQVQNHVSWEQKLCQPIFICILS